MLPLEEKEEIEESGPGLHLYISASRLPVPEVLQPELVRELARAHGVRQVLLVGEDEEVRVPQLVFLQHLLQLVVRLADPLSVVGVDDEDESLGVLEVVAPQRADLVLTADVPHGEANVLVLDRLDVEAFNVKPVLHT